MPLGAWLMVNDERMESELRGWWMWYLAIGYNRVGGFCVFRVICFCGGVISGSRREKAADGRALFGTISCTYVYQIGVGSLGSTLRQRQAPQPNSRFVRPKTGECRKLFACELGVRRTGGVFLSIWCLLLPLFRSRLSKTYRVFPYISRKSVSSTGGYARGGSGGGSLFSTC